MWQVCEDSPVDPSRAPLAASGKVASGLDVQRSALGLNHPRCFLPGALETTLLAIRISQVL
jgi:hypothetical protein